MKKQYQVTITCSDGKYKPVSTIVTIEQDEDVDLCGNPNKKKEIQLKGITNICQKKYWTTSDLKKYHYTRVKIRAYDKARIDAENAARYEKIKEEKYNSGEWKRPKHAQTK